MQLAQEDWVLLRELFRWGDHQYPKGPLRVPLRELAKRTGLHVNTVRVHLGALREAGVVEGPVFEPRPDLLGCERTGVFFLGWPGGDPSELARNLEPWPGVGVVVMMHQALFMHVWHDDTDLAEDEMVAIQDAVAAQAHVVDYRTSAFPPSARPPVDLTPLDWRLVMALRNGPDRSIAHVARELGITERTAERRAKRLVESGAGAMLTVIRPGRVEGAVVAEYVAWDRDPAAAPSLAKAFPERVSGPFGPGIIPNVAVPMPSLHEAELRRVQATRFPGLSRLELMLIRDVLVPGPFEEWLRVRVGNAQERVAKRQMAASAASAP